MTDLLTTSFSLVNLIWVSYFPSLLNLHVTMSLCGVVSLDGSWCLFRCRKFAVYAKDYFHIPSFRSESIHFADTSSRRLRCFHPPTYDIVTPSTTGSKSFCSATIIVTHVTLSPWISNRLNTRRPSFPFYRWKARDGLVWSFTVS